MKNKPVRHPRCALIAVICILVFRTALAQQPATSSPEPSPNPASPSIDQKTMDVAKIWERLLQTPISFYGKIVDDHGAPIADATIKYWITESLRGENPEHVTSSQKDGSFTIKDARGLGITIETSKPGYYHSKESRGSFDYAPGGRGERAVPTRHNPAIFVLRKAGEPANLIEFEKYIRVPKDGTPVAINLENGKTGVPDMDSIQVSSWVSDDQRINGNHFPWRVEFSVSGDGFAECTGEFDFQAPESGYQPSVTIEAPVDAGAQWRGYWRKQFFVKLASQRYARVDLEFIAGGHNRLVVRSHYNPTGSRNLESDPHALIKSLNQP